MQHDKDHIHLHISIPPKLKVCDIVRTIESNSARLMKRKFEHMHKAYWGVDGIWSEGYFVSTIGINESVIKKYVEKQKQQDIGQAQLVTRLY